MQKDAEFKWKSTNHEVRWVIVALIQLMFKLWLLMEEMTFPLQCIPSFTKADGQKRCDVQAETPTAVCWME